jgi:hypothetical protein
MDVIYKVAIVVFICGILLLSFLLFLMPVNLVPLDNVSADYVTTTGRVLSVTNLEKVTFLTIQDSCILEVVVFDEVIVFEGQKITVSGKKDAVDGSFIADRVE